MTLGDRIEKLRKKRGWTQKDLEERSGVPRIATLRPPVAPGGVEET